MSELEEEEKDVKSGEHIRRGRHRGYVHALFRDGVGPRIWGWSVCETIGTRDDAWTETKPLEWGKVAEQRGRLSLETMLLVFDRLAD